MGYARRVEAQWRDLRFHLDQRNRCLSVISASHLRLRETADVRQELLLTLAQLFLEINHPAVSRYRAY